MKLGGPVFEKYDDPSHWLALLRRYGYRASFCPVGVDADEATVRSYREAARKAGIIIAEVGAWSNPLSRDSSTRNQALESCQKGLDLADRIGARCCVNIAGSRGQKWDGPDAADLTEETFDRIVQTVRKIIDAVKPGRTYYTLETMPWMYPDSPDAYLRLIKAIHRRHFAVHLDPVNMVCSPQRYFANRALIREAFQKLGRYIRSCHAKDILLSGKLTTHLDEVRPGLGNLDYATYLKELNRLGPETPLMVEHLPDAKEYALAIKHIRSVARRLRIQC